MVLQQRNVLHHNHTCMCRNGVVYMYNYLFTEQLLVSITLLLPYIHYFMKYLLFQQFCEKSSHTKIPLTDYVLDLRSIRPQAQVQSIQIQKKLCLAITFLFSKIINQLSRNSVFGYAHSLYLKSVRVHLAAGSRAVITVYATKLYDWNNTNICG